MLTDLALMNLHIRALFLTDERDRLLTTNEPDPPPAPRLYLGRTTTGNLYLSEDRGETWRCLGNNLPPIHSVRFA